MIKNLSTSTLFSAFFLLSGMAPAAFSSSDVSCHNPLAEISPDGAILSGSKQAIIKASKIGEPIRVGWVLNLNTDTGSDILHWSDASFLSVFEDEVFTQVQSIQRQRPKPGEATITLGNKHDIWHGLVGTDGSLKGRFQTSGESHEYKVHSIWCSALPPTPVWQAVFQNDTDGTPLSGSKEELFSAIRAGQPVQIGWGVEVERQDKKLSVEHVTSPVFLTIINGTDIVAQLHEHIAQRSYWNSDNALFDKGQVMWRGMVSSTGRFDAIWVDRASGEIVRRSPQRAAFTWYVQRVPQQNISLAREKGVIRDASREAERFPN